MLLHEMLLGITPFGDASTRLSQDAVLTRILQTDIWKDQQALERLEALEPTSSAFILRLLVRDPAARLGAGPSGSADVQADAFFEPLAFERVLRREYPPAWVPPVAAVPAERKTSGPDPPVALKKAASLASGELYDVLEASDEDENDIEAESDEDEWHAFAPPQRSSGDGAGIDQQLFKGFTFRRRHTFIARDLGQAAGSRRFSL